MQSRNNRNLRGIDVSNWQGDIDFAKVRSSGIQVVYIKASEGDYYKDKYLNQNYTNAKTQGLKIGFYHFFRANVDIKGQAKYFIQCIAGKDPDCKLAVDIEATEGFDKDTLSNKCVEFLEEVKRLTGKEVVVYTYTSFARNNLTNAIGAYPLWIAHYGVDTPGDNPIWNKWIGFQYAGDGQVSGISGKVDLNEFTNEIFLLSTVAPVKPSSKSKKMQRGPNPSIIWDYHYDRQIAELQQILNTKGYSLVVDGIAGDKTYIAVKGFTINLGDRGPLTKWVQKRLNTLGFKAGYEDGYAEQPTMDGIARFQASNGLGVGYLGGTDWYYLIK